MIKKNLLKIFIVLSVLLIIFYFFFKDENEIEKLQIDEEKQDSSYALNIIENVDTTVSKKAMELGTLRLIDETTVISILKKYHFEILDNQGICFKPYPNHVMEKLGEELIKSLNKLSDIYPNLSAMKLLIAEESS